MLVFINSHKLKGFGIFKGYSFGKFLQAVTPSNLQAITFGKF